MRLVAALLVGVMCLALSSKYHVAAQYYKPISSSDAPQRLAYPKIGRTSSTFSRNLGNQAQRPKHYRERFLHDR